MEPLFAIITSSYNASGTIARTLESVDAQTFTDYEHLIVDGNSSDGTQAIVSAHGSSRRRIVSEPDNGLYDAMNKGMSLTTGRYFIFLNAGDCFHASDTLDRFARAILRNEYPGIVYGQTVIVDSEGRYVGPRHHTAPDNLTLASFKEGMLVCHQAFVALRRICGLYDRKYRFSADYEWCIRCLQHSRKNVLVEGAEPVIDYLDGGLTSKNRFRSLRERFSIMSYHYGFWGTLMRHFRFVFRAFGRMLKKK